ncbi:hypothetical protein Lalb_Chr17g0341601 [Lupinus albus]|uniref:Uncharacterized protein n=1 Tax=Lupinus albus TaxID=3870 RepID=A0A6A4NZH0_LUPAL|nr:hypothetical protein Lalb_Chr17g0341601 [Lupinus albus]
MFNALAIYFIGLENNAEGTSIRMRNKSYYKFWLGTWRVVIHPHYLTNIFK